MAKPGQRIVRDFSAIANYSSATPMPDMALGDQRTPLKQAKRDVYKPIEQPAPKIEAPTPVDEDESSWFCNQEPTKASTFKAPAVSTSPLKALRQEVAELEAEQPPIPSIAELLEEDDMAEVTTDETEAFVADEAVAEEAQELVPLDPQEAEHYRPIAALPARLKELGGHKSDPPESRPMQLLWVPVSLMVVDTRYQRELRKDSIRAIYRIVEEFDWAKFGIITVVALRDGRYAVIDGQHRATGAATKFDDDQQLPCVVVDMPFSEAAANFVAINTRKISISALSAFKASVASGDRTAASLQAVMLENECRFVPNSASANLKRGDCLALTTLRKIHDTDGAHVLDLCLKAYASSILELNVPISSLAVEGLAVFIGDELKAGRLRDVDALVDVCYGKRFDTLSDEIALQRKGARTKGIKVQAARLMFAAAVSRMVGETE